MTIPRKLLIDRSGSGIYHCYSRCVRRAFLCGNGYEHRRGWIRDRLIELADIFMIDVGAYGILENHFHVIARTNPEEASQLRATRVVRLWSRLFPASIRRWAAEDVGGEPPAKMKEVIRIVSRNPDRVAVLRDRLSDLSWFMRCLKEPIARRANREDGVTGCFWEGRFKSQALLDDLGLLTCMVYVDLNVIRALLASTPEGSDYTSVQERIFARQLYEMACGRRRRAPKRARVAARHLPAGRAPRWAEDGIWLAPIERRSGSRFRGRTQGLLSMTLDDYLAIVDASGRLARPGKRGRIPAELRPILERLEIDGNEWAKTMSRAGRVFGTALGSAKARAAEAARRGTKWVVGVLGQPRARPSPARSSA